MGRYGSDEDIRVHWEMFYREMFAINVDLTDVRISEHRSGFNWVIVIVNRLTLDRVIEACKDWFERFVLFGITSPERRSMDSDRTARKESYAVRVATGQETDKRIKDLSAEQLTEQGISGITLFERLIAELDYFMGTRELPSTLDATLCSGSRDSHVRVPSVRWADGRRLRVEWDDPCRDNVPPTLFVLVR